MTARTFFSTSMPIVEIKGATLEKGRNKTGCGCRTKGEFIILTAATVGATANVHLDNARRD